MKKESFGKLSFFLSIILFEVGITVAILINVLTAIIIFTTAFIFLIIWFLFGKIDPYNKSPFAHMPNWFFYKRSWRIKSATLVLILLFVVIQLDIGFYTSDKPWVDNIAISWFAISAGFFIIIFLLRDILANKKNKCSTSTDNDQFEN